MKKTILVFVCIVALMLSGCQGESVLPDNKTPPIHSSNVGEKTPDNDSPTSSPDHSTDFPELGGDPGEVNTSGFQREMNVHHPFRINTACKTENGYYFEYSWFLYFMDAASGEMIAVCSKPECGHDSQDCNAYIQANLLSYYQGKLYYVTTAYLDADYHSIDTLCSMNLDGTNHTDLQKVRIDLTAPRAGCADPLLVGGTVYFMEADHSVYRVALGQDVGRATLLLEENIPEKMENAQAFTSNTDWKFWADGDDIYAMCHVFTRSGEYVDILYFLGADRSDSREIWRSSEIGISGQRDNTSSWYILNGHLYYYFSGFDLWDIDLNTGGAVTLASLAGKIKSGTAVFTDHYAIILDDQPQANSAGLYRQGGKNISVYDYSGNLLKTVDLSFIYEEYPNTYHCELIFANGNTVFLQGYIGMDHGMTSHLYQINWESGTAREINSWPASDVPYDDSVKEIVIPGGGFANASAPPAQTSGDIRDTSSIENDSSGAAGAATLDEQAGERKLKSEGSLRGEIEITHKLSLGKIELSDGETVLFHIETKSADSELKITLAGSEIGTTLEGSVTGSSDISFEINIADEYTVVLENCSLRGVQFTIDYSIGGSK